MAFSNGYTIAFATGICVICSTTLATLSMGLKDMQDDTRRRDLYKNILISLDPPAADADGERRVLTGEEIDTMWADKIELKAVDPATGAALDASKADLDGNGSFDYLDLKLANDTARRSKTTPEILGLFVRTDTQTVAVPMVGKGLWGPISAYVALDTKLENVTGTTFFAPKETPGLGAEITKPKFVDQWAGKSIIKNGAVSPIRVLKPSGCDEKADKYCVDGVSGATITSRGVDAMLDDTIALYKPYIEKERK